MSGERSLPEIIWSCLATIFACTWVAAHPGVPLPSHDTEPKWYRFKKRAILVASAIFAPELMVLLAIVERLEAGKIVKEYNKLYDIGEEYQALSVIAN